MTDEILAISVIWGFVFIYAVMATMDFGAGFWSMIYLDRKQTKATNVANRYLSPTWEVTNTFIAALVVAIYSLFPKATYTLGTILIIPGSTILLLLALRSAFLVFSNIATDYVKPLSYISGITGIIIPGILICILPITHGSYIEYVDGTANLSLAALFTSPNAYAFIGFGISSTLFLSSLLLADYSKVSTEMHAYKVYLRDAQIMGPISLIMAILIVFTLRNEASWLYDRMLADSPLLWLSVLSFLIAGLGLFLPSFFEKGVRGMPRISVVATIIQYLIASYVYGKAHLPYFIYPNITIQDGVTDPNSFRVVFATYIVGFVILFPGFFYFWRLFMNDKKYIQQGKEEKE
ncbi:cytochrome d ubiquinol oxidase subunit II [Paenibacillus shirakamiensis]|uniref:Cytochrome d ubiquinol oxidase subunit II n=1 Tax=Paenibacillus shirakamiensis TaxID=1265935 RepID=A0ABS4JE70_9BACL|nr:cytochrome d ubiquinol oxidase subunit II [Paenibacillus shirakamiensis]MBP1999993.1 cytochrome d ubiquinol oxidase subunit II [Paenibacillus shirakamiensis]